MVYNIDERMEELKEEINLKNTINPGTGQNQYSKILLTSGITEVATPLLKSMDQKLDTIAKNQAENTNNFKNIKSSIAIESGFIDTRKFIISNNTKKTTKPTLGNKELSYKMF